VALEGTVPTGRARGAIHAGRVDGWLRDLGIEPLERTEREGVTSWDVVLDGRVRQDVRLTLILDPGLAFLAWAQFAPPLNDSFRVSYRQFLRWNDELPFVKFGLAEDERPVLTAEVAVESLDRDALGLAIVRLLAVCDLLLAESVRWLWPGRKSPPPLTRPSRHADLLDRYGPRLGDLDAASREAGRGGPEPRAGIDPRPGGPGGHRTDASDGHS
jgi:hypothetical protein